MATPTLTQKLSVDWLDAQARSIAADILLTVSWDQRQPIEDYGRCLLHCAPPDDRLTRRFWTRLHILALRLPNYTRAIAMLSYNRPAIADLQNAIARYVAAGQVG